MFCSQCGTESQPEARFCHKCGFAFPEKTAQPTARIEPHIAEARAETPPIVRTEPLIAKPHISQAGAEPKERLDDNYHPWRRFFARSIDILTLGLVSLVVVVLVASVVFPSKASAIAKIFDSQIIGSCILLIWWIPLEAFLLSTAGNTPAKWLFGISIKTIDGNNLSFEAALQRTFLVVLQGMGFGLPIVSILTHIFAYRRLADTETTLWDTAVKSVVSHKTWSAERTIICVFVALVTYTFLAVLVVMSKA